MVHHGPAKNKFAQSFRHSLQLQIFEPNFFWRVPNPQKGLSPEFRATRLWRGFKKRASLEIFCLFPVFQAKKGPQKNLRETLVTSDTRVSLVKVLPNNPLVLTPW